jgi:hypothetical protein
MKKIILSCCVVVGFSAHAQLHTKPLSCGPVFSGFPFTVQFKGETASLSFKDETYELRFDRSWKTTQGDQWTDYLNEELVVSTSWPEEPYVAISLKNRKNSMAACDVQEAN